jgi:alkyl hydroperoxide reductase subunit AhpF
VPIFRPDEEASVRDLLGKMERDVELALVVGPEAQPVPGAREIDFSGEARRILEELVALSERLTLSLHEPPAFGAEHLPAIAVLPEGEDVGIRYLGLPWGYELGSLIGACLDAGHPEPILSETSRDQLVALERDVTVDVFVTPT